MDSQGRVGEHLHLSLREESNRLCFDPIVGCFERRCRPVQSQKILFHHQSQIIGGGIFAVQTIDGSVSHDLPYLSLHVESAVDFSSAFRMFLLRF